MAENKYKKLLKNSSILGVGEVLSKLLVFILLPLYSSVLTTGEYGIATLVPSLSDYILLLGMYVFMFALNTICGSFLRGMDAVKPFAIKGIICTAANLLFNIIFLLVFKLGVTGYLLANICGDFVAVLYMFWGGDLLDYIEPRQITRPILLDMIRFSVPLIPTTICWWIVNMSDRFMITYMVNEGAKGVYAAA